MNKEQAAAKLASIGQSKLLSYWDELSTDDQRTLLQQIASLDLTTFYKQKALLSGAEQKNSSPPLFPFHNYASEHMAEYQKKGLEAIAKGQVGCLIVAGGQGSRLKFDGPKGLYPVTVIKRKSLFQLAAEKVVAASKLAKRPLPLAIMTSPLNDATTKEFFRSHNNFGLEADQLFFFSQEMLPLLNEKGELFLESKGKIAEGPDGNGGALSQFVASGIGEKWHQSGVRHLLFAQIDNVLSDPFDTKVVGFHIDQQADISLQCIRREDIHEKVGVVVTEGDKTVIKEYSELSTEEQKARLPDGSLKHICANISYFCFDMDFISKVTQNYEMPLHLAFKAVPYLSDEGITQQAAHPIAWKFEKFIFDVLPQAHSVKVLLCPREECFAALKNSSGDHSLETVKAALLSRDRIAYEKISGLSAPLDRPFELAQDFHYPTVDLKENWRGKPLPNQEYIEA